MGYFDNLDNGFLNKYQKNLKNRKKFMIDSVSNFLQFHYHDSSSKTVN
jgi:hypothetical protein